MSRFFGWWTLGDVRKNLELELLKQDGTAFNLSSITSVTLLGMARGETLTAVGAALGAPTLGIASFPNITAGLELTGVDHLLFPCRARVVEGGQQTDSEEFWIGVTKFPRNARMPVRLTQDEVIETFDQT
jgi:hypothetical protein